MVGVTGAATRVISSVLFEVPALDLLTFAVVAGLLSRLDCLLVMYPRGRAMKVDPMVALRYE